MIRQGRSALRTTVIPVSLVRLKVDQTKAGNGNFFGSRAKKWMARRAADTPAETIHLPASQRNIETMQLRYCSRPNCFSTLPERSDEADKYYWTYYSIGGGLDCFGLLEHGTDG
ncbi:hypothetical protein DXT95_07445 [Agrobacterium tumefaciens]|nr:hypothetical protein [Agrobacterium tumefaciens]